jgi:hypothetical protein
VSERRAAPGAADSPVPEEREEMNGASRGDAGLTGWLSRGRVLGISAALASISQVSILAMLHSGLDPFALLVAQTTLSEKTFLEITGGWGDASWRAFYRHYWIDFLHPCLYGVFLASAVAHLLRQRGLAGGSARHLVLLPLLAGACDEVENVCQLLLVRGLPDFSTGLFVTGALAANLKWAAVAVSLATIGILSLRRSDARLR